MQEEIRQHLNELSIEWLEIKGEDIDLKVQLGANRIWKGGADRNLPVLSCLHLQIGAAPRVG